MSWYTPPLTSIVHLGRAMSLIQSIVDFFASYGIVPRLLMLGGIVLTFATAIVAERDSVADKPQPPDTEKRQEQSEVAAIPSVKIESPPPGATVAEEFDVSGMANSQPADGSLWLVSSSTYGDKFWPQHEITVESNGDWVGRVNFKLKDGNESGTSIFGVYVLPSSGEDLVIEHMRKPKAVDGSKHMSKQEFENAAQAQALVKRQVTVTNNN